jgi:hypothetical protein
MGYIILLLHIRTNNSEGMCGIHNYERYQGPGLRGQLYQKPYIVNWSMKIRPKNQM